jgi:16S rRNA (cytosine1402-N4)-methyltransferase
MIERERHVPVLLQQAIRYLNVRRGGTYVDATLGLAGHSSAIARLLGPQGKLIAFDRDPEAMALAKARLDALREDLGAEMPEVVLHDVEFSRAADLIEPASINGLLADFGVSSMQFDEAHRGFSFQADGPLEMRMNPRQGVSAAQVVNQIDE